MQLEKQAGIVLSSVSFFVMACCPEQARAGFEIEIIVLPPIYSIDSDGDGVNDGWEIEFGTDPSSYMESDGDGLSDDYEKVYSKTDHLNPDTDGDTISDGDEARIYQSNPNSADSDGDKLPDNEELYHGTRLNWHDTDGDGLSDFEEVKVGTSPHVKDCDGDGLWDSFEVQQLGTDPYRVDTDAGGVSDFIEFAAGTDPLNYTDDPCDQVAQTDTQINSDGGFVSDSKIEVDSNFYTEWYLSESPAYFASLEAMLEGVTPTMPMPYQSSSDY